MSSYTYRPRGGGFYMGGLPPVVKWLLISNIGLFLLGFLAAGTTFGGLFLPLALIPSWVVEHFAVWQLVTYMFLHSATDFGHILFNMLSLWMFGSDLERTWGSRQFLKFYLFCGVGAGLLAVIGNYLYGTPDTRTIGASGAIYGVMMAFALLFPDTTILFILFPIRAKYFVMILGAIAFLSTLKASGSGVSHVAHLGGLLFGYLWVRTSLGGARRGGYGSRGGGRNPLEYLRTEYDKWRRARARRKFEVYLKKRDSKDRWVQ
ncbi:MAG: rhomboid family intramembrane serine protease [Bryobacteraceae bacterium]|nr:rhomboid family intramembrane serine protease [Bryobacteraceae bacterium]